MRLLIFSLSLLLLVGCYKLQIVGDRDAKVRETPFQITVTMKTLQGPETVSVSTESAVLCKWIQTNIKKYGSLAHVKAVGKCNKETSGELQQDLPQQAR